MLPELSHEEILRYSRHLLIPDVGLEGQRKLKAASILVIGTGGLGSPVALYLAAAGIGHLGIVDYDEVEVSNLQRQIIHSQDSVDRLKVDFSPRPHARSESRDRGGCLQRAIHLAECHAHRQRL